MITRHEFLARLHHLLTPRTYLEVGVHTGESLRLASCPAIGVDPNPMVSRPPANATIYPVTSDDFFATHVQDALAEKPLDLAFIDGMHLWEFALRDFINVERWAHRRTVVLFDDMLPRNQVEAAREQCPGDWTGDVWKVHQLLDEHRPDLSMRLVDTFPTGVLLVWGLQRNNLDLAEMFTSMTAAEREELNNRPVPTEVMFRSRAVTAEAAIKDLKEDMR